MDGLMIFESDPDQIKQLGSFKLVKLMKRLMLSECRLVDIPLRGVSVHPTKEPSLALMRMLDTLCEKVIRDEERVRTRQQP
jgi:hypothetical protein